jgi:hypothetical protein
MGVRVSVTFHISIGIPMVRSEVFHLIGLIVFAMSPVLAFRLFEPLSCAGPRESGGPLLPGVGTDQFTRFVFDVRVQILSAR